MPDEESLQRPSEMSFRVTKIKPVSADMIEVYTESSLQRRLVRARKGNIIYVLSNKSGKWVVKDVYARGINYSSEKRRLTPPFFN